jgi:hypothetical protein
MKKIFLLSVTILFLTPIILQANTEVYIYPVATDKPSYGNGDALKGQFTIHNLLDERQTDVFYEVGISSGDTFESAIIMERKKFDPLFLESKSKRIVPFDYVIPNSADGQSYVFVNAYSADGNLLALGNAPILIKKNEKTVVKETVLPTSVYLTDDFKGPNQFVRINRFYPDQEVSIEMLFPKIKNNTKVKASIKATQVNSKEGFTPGVFNFSLESKKETNVKVPLPVLNIPGIYEIDVMFESDTVFIPSFNFTYYVIGPSITFTQMNASHLSFKKNKEIEINTVYTLPMVFSQEEYQLVVEPLKNVTATVSVVNEKSEIVFEDTQQFDLTQSDKVVFKKKALVSADSISAVVKVFDKDNNLINEYKSNFPSEEQMQSWYDSGNIKLITVLVVFLILIIVILAVLYKKKYRKVRAKNKTKGASSISLILFTSIFIAFALFYSPVNASTVEQGTMITNGWTFTGFLNEVFYSPLPQEVRSYGPGEIFDLYASIGAHGNLMGGTGTNIRLHTQSTYCHPQTGVCNWYQASSTPPTSLYGALSPFHQRNSYCPTNAIQNLHDWFLCRGTINSGFQPGVWGDTSLNLANFVSSWQGVSYLIPSLDWYGSGLLTGSANLPATKEFEADVQTIFAEIYAGIIREVNHDNADPTGYTGDLAHGWMFRMFSERCLWFQNGVNGRYLHNWCSHQLLNFKYSYLEQAFVPERSDSYRRDMYTNDLRLINLVKNTIIKNNLPNANIVANFDFNNKEAIHQSNYNSPEFNQAIAVILDFLHELSSSLHNITYNTESLIKTQELLHPYRHAFVARFYDIQKNNLKMPMQGGVYKIFYYGLLAQSKPSWEPTWKTDDKDVLVSQTVCVRGSGVCPDEEPIVCPNLIGEFRKVDTVIQQKNGSVWDNTEYVENLAGQCVLDTHTLTADASPVGQTTATINWDYANVLGQDVYEVQVSLNQNMTPILQTNTGGSVDTSSNFTGLTPNTVYYARVRINNSISWSDYVNLSFTTEPSLDNCSCSGRTQICVNGPTTNNSSQCQFQVSCLANINSQNAVFNLIGQNTIGANIIYVYNGVSTTKSKNLTHVITKPKVPGNNSINFSATDSGDGSEYNSACSVNNLGGPDGMGTSSPSITMSKSWPCNISWSLENIPATSTCTLTGGGNTTSLTQIQSPQNFAPILSNRKYTIMCSGGGLPTPITSSVICRANPRLIEN